MKEKKIIDAVGGIDFDMVEDAYGDAEQKPKRIPRFVKWGSIAACICLAAILAVHLILPGAIPNEDGNVNSADIMCAVWFNGFLYEECTETTHTDIPELEALTVNEGNRHSCTVTEDDLGDYIGVFPAIEPFELPEGQAYRWKAHPEFESVIIVKYEDGCRLFVTYGNAVAEEYRTNSDTLFEKLGFPESVSSISVEAGGEKIGDDIENDAVIASIFELLGGKTPVSRSEINSQVWDAWCEERGASGITYDGEVDFTYPSAEIREQFVNFRNGDLHSLWITTDTGFRYILLTYNEKFNEFHLCGSYFRLTDAEMSELKALIEEGTSAE